MERNPVLGLGRIDSLCCPGQHGTGLIEPSDPPTRLRQGQQDAASAAPQLQDWVADHIGELQKEINVLTKRVVLQIVERDNIRVWIVIVT